MPERIIIQRVQTVEKICPTCGRTFEAVSKQGYCSPVCRNRADYRRHAEQRRAARRERYERTKAAS